MRELAIKKGFGEFSYFFPIGIDAGICVLLALDLLLTWIRMPFPLLRQTAWLLTVATVAFNAAAATDPLGRAMHAVIPVLFVVTVEAARHAVGRIADITRRQAHGRASASPAGCSPRIPTFLLWRRMKLWELRSYEQVIKLEQDRLVYQARLHSRFGRAVAPQGPVESMMPLRLARYGVPLAGDGPLGSGGGGHRARTAAPRPAVGAGARSRSRSRHRSGAVAAPVVNEQPPQQQQQPEYVEPQSQWLQARDPQAVAYQGGYDPTYDPDRRATRSGTAEQQQAEQFQQYEEEQQQFAQQRHEQQQFPQQQHETSSRTPEPSPEDTGTFPIPAGPGRTRELGAGGGTGTDRGGLLLGLQEVDRRQLPDLGPVQGRRGGHVQHHAPAARGGPYGQPLHEPPHGGNSRSTTARRADTVGKCSILDGRPSPAVSSRGVSIRRF
ncbi:DUF2637 domain-containing protein [Streptomyces sp. L7]